MQVKMCSVPPMATMEVTRDELYAALKFYFCLKISSVEVCAMLQEAYRESILPYSIVRRWFQIYKELQSVLLREKTSTSLL